MLPDAVPDRRKSDFSVDLGGVDFGDARIDGASFWSVDLTGARLDDASFETLSFNDVTCPDGKPMKAGAYGLAACRIKAP